MQIFDSGDAVSMSDKRRGSRHSVEIRSEEGVRRKALTSFSDLISTLDEILAVCPRRLPLLLLISAISAISALLLHF